MDTFWIRRSFFGYVLDTFWIRPVRTYFRYLLDTFLNDFGYANLEYASSTTLDTFWVHFGYVLDTFWIRFHILDMFWIRFGYVLDTSKLSRENFGYAPSSYIFGNASSEVREGCTKMNFGYVLDTCTPLQVSKNFGYVF